MEFFSAIARKCSYSHPQWATCGQWPGLCAQVRKGERSATVVFWKVFCEPRGSDTLNTDEEEQVKSERPCVARAYHVFNAVQVEAHASPEFLHPSSSERIANAEENIPVLRVSGHFM